ncbi:MAG: EFR1 family ferrodoxin [Muribaculaceae bacterium]|nr:EFR1 family ferrodoxin [Muribaculaceae bacterium]MDE6321697.1 EFR1 family ferrodoxin [Muribaculaceae bacterium]
MIICYTGTGNSLAVAQHLADAMGDNVVRLEGDILTSPGQNTIDISGHKRVVWCFPVYSWGVPPVMCKFLKQITLNGDGTLPHYMVATCGDDAGRTHTQWRHLVSARGWDARNAFTVVMPNTYTLMKGFNVDPADVEQTKLAKMPGAVEHITQKILSGGRGDEVLVGKWSLIKSGIIYPWFVRYAMSPKPFHHTDACISCEICARSCPMTNISMVDGHPQWHDNCALCLRCYHLCPKHAVAYGKATINKGQYHNPSL